MEGMNIRLYANMNPNLDTSTTNTSPIILTAIDLSCWLAFVAIQVKKTCDCLSLKGVVIYIVQFFCRSFSNHCSITDFTETSYSNSSMCYL